MELVVSPKEVTQALRRAKSFSAALGLLARLRSRSWQPDLTPGLKLAGKEEIRLDILGTQGTLHKTLRRSAYTELALCQRLAGRLKAFLSGSTAQLAQYLGVSQRYASVMQAVHEEFHEWKLSSFDKDMCMLTCGCYLLVWCCCGCDSQTLLETGEHGVPGQQSMDAPMQEPGSLLEAFQSRITPEQVQQLFEGEQFAKRENFLLWLMGKRFGKQDKKDFQACLAEVKTRAPTLLTEDEAINAQVEADVHLAKTNSRATVRLAKTLTTALLAKHGEQLQQHGLSALGLGACEKLLCDGSLSYELTAGGMHQCRWNCPAGFMPKTYKELRLAQDGVVEPMPLTVSANLSESAAEDVINDSDKPERDYEASSTWSILKDLPYDNEPAFSAEPLKILKALSPTELGGTMPAAFRYWGECRTADAQVGDLMVFQGDGEIPKGTLVKVEYLEGSGNIINWRPTVPAGSASVKYQDQAVMVNLGDLRHVDVVPVKLPRGIKDWLLATNDTLQLHMPLPSGDKSTKDTYYVTPELSKCEGLRSLAKQREEKWRLRSEGIQWIHRGALAHKADDWRQALLLRLEPRPGVVFDTVLLSACARQRAWACAQALLRDTEPDVVALNSAVHALPWAEALQLLQLGRASRLADEISGNSGAAACQREGRWREALRFPGNLFTSSSVLAAAALAEKWLQALASLGGMALCTAQPNAVSFNAAMSACLNRWRRAENLLGSAKEERVGPDVVGFGSLLASCRAAWKRALLAMAGLQARLPRASSAARGALLAALGFAQLWRRAFGALGPRRSGLLCNTALAACSADGLGTSAMGAWRAAGALLKCMVQADRLSLEAALAARPPWRSALAFARAAATSGRAATAGVVTSCCAGAVWDFALFVLGEEDAEAVVLGAVCAAVPARWAPRRLAQLADSGLRRLEKNRAAAVRGGGGWILDPAR
ncbi:unnamed protein product, partial [Effrenium voratum]